MSGGASQTDTFDLKPGHANGGPFKEIATKVQGIRISEHLPAIAKFTDKIEFVFRDTYQCGNEEANVGHILITTGGYQVTAEGVFTYKADADGRLVALRAYWEMDRAATSARKV